MTTKKELQDRLDLVTKRHQSELDGIKTQIAALPDDESGAGVPEMGQTYFSITINGNIDQFTWRDQFVDHVRLEMGNVFFTNGEAQDRLNHMKALAKLRSLTKGFVPDWKDGKQMKGYPVYDYNLNTWGVGFTYLERHSNLPHFATVEDSKAAIEAMGDQMEHLLRGGW